MLLNRVDQRERHTRAVSLGDEADALVDDLLQHRQAFLRRGFVVERHELELDAGPRQLLCIHDFRHELEVVQKVCADSSKRT